MNKNKIYSEYKLCTQLLPNEKCFCLYEYNEGAFIELFHEHVKKHRISDESSCNFVKTLIIQNSSLGNTEILRSFLNKRGKEPGNIKLFQIHTEYPEAGVLRKYFSSGHFTAWFDEVISPTTFRSINI